MRDKFRILVPILVPAVLLAAVLLARTFILNRNRVTLDASQILAPGQTTLYGKSNNEGDAPRGTTSINDASSITLTVNGSPVLITLDTKTVFTCIPSKQLIDGKYIDISGAYIDTTSTIVTDSNYRLLDAEVFIRPEEVTTKIYPGIKFIYVAPKEGSMQKVVFFDCH